MQDTLLSFGRPHHDPPAPPAPAEAQRILPIAPWWHTVAVLAMLAIWAGVGSRRVHAYTGTPHLATYLSQVMLTWMMFGAVVAGIVSRSGFFFATLRHRANTFFTDAASGLAIYAGFFFAVTFAVSIAIVVTTAVHKSHASSTPAQTQSSSPSGSTLPPPVPAVPAKPDTSLTQPFDPKSLHFNSKTVMELAPSTPFELLFWLGLSFSAGFCEEHVFRGYLLRQGIAFLQSIGIASPAFAKAVAILITSAIFGSLHLYEGVGGAVLIATLGCVYSVIALRLGNLRAVIAAHFLQDFIAGTMLFFFRAHLPH